MKNTPSPSLDPRMLANHFHALGQDDPALKTIEIGFTKLCGTMKTIYKAREKNAANPLQTDLGNAKATADFTGKVSVPALKTAQASIDNATATINSLQSGINAPLNRKGEHAAETRSLMRELKHEGRRKLLSNAVNNNDTDALAAVLTAPAYLSGIDQPAADSFREQYHRQNNPQALRRVKHLTSAIELLDNAGRIFGAECGKVMHPKGLEKARQLEKAAQEASHA
jgi:hypothetical protein